MVKTYYIRSLRDGRIIDAFDTDERQENLRCAAGFFLDADPPIYFLKQYQYWKVRR